LYYNHGYDKAIPDGRDWYIHYTDVDGTRKVAGPYSDEEAATRAKYRDIIYEPDGNAKRGVSGVSMETDKPDPTPAPDRQIIADRKSHRILTVAQNDPKELHHEQDRLYLQLNTIEEALADGKFKGDVARRARERIEENKTRMREIDAELLATEGGLDWGPERSDTKTATVESIRYTMDPNTGVSKRVHPYWAPLNFARGFTFKEPNQQAQIMTRALKALRTPGPNGDPPSWVVADPTRPLNSPITYEDDGRTARVGGKFKAYVIKDPPYTDPESGDYVPSRITFLLPEEY